MNKFTDTIKPKYDFHLCNIDTDSISLTKSNGYEFSPEEMAQILKELNSEYPEMIKFDDDGFFEAFIVVKAKNYILKQGDKVKIKGSGLRASMKEKRLKQFIRDFIDILLIPDFKEEQLVDLYNEYAKEIINLKDISGYTSKKTITDKILKPERTTELKIKLAIKNEVGVQEGDKIQVFFLPDQTLCLEKNFKGDYCKATLLKKLYMTVKIFDTIIPKTLFPNYGLKRNYEEFLSKNTIA
jgi:DNA polymerase elongation subunit (family B)